MKKLAQMLFAYLARDELKTMEYLYYRARIHVKTRGSCNASSLFEIPRLHTVDAIA
jgi:hypothetical protein